MEREDLREVDLTRLQEGYSSQWELFNDLCAWLDLLLYYHYRHHRWLGPDSELKNMLGLVVSREEFEHMLARSAQVGLSAQVSDEEWDELSLTRQAILLRLERTTAELPLLSLFSRCGLDEFEQNCVILAYAGTVDKKYEKLFAYLQDDMTSRAPGLSLAVQLFLPRGESMEAYLGRFARQDGFLRLFQAEALSRGTLILRDVVAEFLSTGTISHRPGREIFDGAALTARRPMVVHGAIARQLDAVLEDTAPEPGKVVEVTDKGFSVEDGSGNVREQAITNVPAPKRPAAEDSEPGPKLDATGAPLTEGGRKILSAQEDMDLIDPKAAGEQSRDTLTLLMMDQQPDVNIDRTVTPAPEKPSGDADVKKEEKKDHDGGQHI